MGHTAVQNEILYISLNFLQNPPGTPPVFQELIYFGFIPQAQVRVG